MDEKKPPVKEAALSEAEIRDAFKRLHLPLDDKAKLLRCFDILGKIGVDDAEFLLRAARVDLKFEDMTTWEKIDKYLLPVIIALVCLAVDRLMLHLLQ